MATGKGPPRRRILATSAVIVIFIWFAVGCSGPPARPANGPGTAPGDNPGHGPPGPRGNTASEHPGPHSGGPDLKELSAEDLVARLSFLSSPIAGARVASADSLLPGAPREYRNGIHQGLDYYDGYCGVPIRAGDPVVAAADGYVLRADHAYVEMTETERASLLRESHAAAETPEHILDRLRGRQVWLSHGGGVVTRYAHLASIPAEVRLGTRVQPGQVIGFVGNSGTSAGARGTETGAHLHFEIWVNGEPFWKYLGGREIRHVLEAILND